MRKVLYAIGLVLAGVLAGTAASDAPPVVGNLRIYVDNAFACNDTSGTTIVAVADATGTFSARFISISNDGANEAFVDFNGGTSTTADVRINSTGTQGSVFTAYVTDNSTNAISCVASSGETTTLRIVAMR